MNNSLHAHLPSGVGGAQPLQRAPLRAIPTGEANDIAALAVAPLGPFLIGPYDTVALSYTGTNLTGVTYSYQGKTMGTLALTYSAGGLLTQVERTA